MDNLTHTPHALFPFIEGIAARKRQLGHATTGAHYERAAKRFMQFCQNPQIGFADLTPVLMENYEAWLRRAGCCPNSTSFYLRVLKSAYLQAVKQGLVADTKPFHTVFCGKEKTRKRAIPLDEMLAIRRLDLTDKPQLELARDMFLFSFYSRGMSMVDVANLKPSNIKNNYICYSRRKTGQRLKVEINPLLRALIAKYRTPESPYLLPILSRLKYETALRYINHNLKEVARMAGIAAPLTTYVARHSWASAAQTKDIPIQVISQGLGHTDLNTTQIYLSSITTGEIDRANALILADF